MCYNIRVRWVRWILWSKVYEFDKKNYSKNFANKTKSKKNNRLSKYRNNKKSDRFSFVSKFDYLKEFDDKLEQFKNKRFT